MGPLDPFEPLDPFDVLAAFDVLDPFDVLEPFDVLADEFFDAPSGTNPRPLLFASP